VPGGGLFCPQWSFSRQKQQLLRKNRKAVDKVVIQVRIVPTNLSWAAGRGGILANMVQVFLLGRDYGNLFLIWACRGLRFMSGAVCFWGRERLIVRNWARITSVK
jgi:predicted N-acyltransferase